ncbi:MAG: SMI1/KNR4 family protein [Burkholderiales bacterium]|nr:SMI1/KNR4 family protein [Burkholderiales bacterium]
MSKPVDAFVKFVQGRNPLFTRKRSAGGNLPLKHLPERPPTAAAQKKLEVLLDGASPELLELYRHFDGGRYFADAKDIEQSFYFIPIGEMKTAKRELEDWLFMHPEAADEYSEEKDEEGRPCLLGPPPWWKSAVVFAGFGYAPERLYLTPEGKHAGKVFLYDHDSDSSICIAPSVNKLLFELCTNSAAFLQRYGTGFFDLQEYRADAP